MVEVFVDEYGDRGFGPKASRYFAMTALLVPQESIRHMRAVTIGLRGVINTPKPLHWVDHFTPKPKHAWRRQLAADLIAGIPGAVLIYLLADKATLTASDALRGDKDRFYNYATRLLLERVDRATAGWTDGARRARVRMGAVKNQDHDGTLAYLDLVRRSQGEFAQVTWPVTWHGPEAYDGLQLADLAMGMFSTALRGDATDRECATHLLRIRRLTRRAQDGSVLGYGVKVYGCAAVVENRVWWAEFCTHD